MSIFQKSVLNKYINSLDAATIDQAWDRYTTHFHNKDIQDNIRKSKEEQYQRGFLVDLFVKILGYTINPEPNFNLTTELKNVKGAKKVDGAILDNGNAIAVIELKGMNTKDLSKVESQAFGYKNNQPHAVYVVTSNFQKLRFYIDKAIDFEAFNLFELTKDQFKLLWLCLSKESLLQGIPKKIKEESLTVEETVTKKLYKDYSDFKNAIFNDLTTKNPTYDKLTLYKKTQKLLDRFLFIFFAEDKGLLPPNSIRQVLKQWNNLKELDAYTPLYARYQKYFGYLNTGHKGKQHDIFAYNGGLFATDSVLDTVTIDDDILYKHTLKLSDYDFDSEVSVNILGHIFEHSLNEIEEITAQLEGKEIDAKKTKRKKDGVFYTPKYITKYIVDNTVGKLCIEKKQEFSIDEAEYTKDRKGRTKKKLKELNDNLEMYREWLTKITICDPACGSGAFLNQALEFLMTEHAYIDELQAALLGGGIVFKNVKNVILENNLYGVDINDESVEIAKLSLWLRTAEKGRKLTSLSNNLKVGNSLIDDPKIDPLKAFNWKQEFPTVFENGGFDVVIGNPPYVRHELITSYKKYLKENFKVFQSIGDLYIYFIEKGISIIKEKGLLGYITPNKFIQATYGKKLRPYIGENTKIRTLIDFGELPVFADAATFPLISILSKGNKNESEQSYFVKVKSLKSLDLETYIETNKINIDLNTFKRENWILISKNEKKTLEKIINKGTPLKDFLNIKFYRGILTGFNEAFIINEEQKKKLISKDSNSKEIIKPFVDGDDVRRYHLRNKGKYLIFTRRGIDIERYPAIKEYLFQFYDRLKPKKTSKDKIGRKKGDYEWYEIQDSISYYKEFEKSKIIYPEIAKESRFTIDNNNIYLNKTIFLIPFDNKYLLSILNSKVVWYYLMNVCPALGDPKNGGRLNLQKIYLETIPIIDTPNKTKFIELASKQLTDSKNFHISKSDFIGYLQAKHELPKISKKMDTWYLLEEKDFLKELKKAKVKIEGMDEFNLLKVFKSEKEKALNVKAIIDQTDKEIDQMVYKLYGLTDEEIQIVEAS